MQAPRDKSMSGIRTSLHQIEIWYLFMVLLGAFNVGFSIMLVPQFIVNEFLNGVTVVGVVMSAWTAGPLIGPLFSRFIDRFGSPGQWMAALFLFNSLLCFALPFCISTSLLLINIFFQGLIYAVGYSILNLLIIRRFNEREWHGRTAMLIGGFILGEVIGFGIAGRLASPQAGFALGGYIMLAASVMALFLIPDFRESLASRFNDDAVDRESTRIVKLLASPFGLMAVGWGLLCFSAQILFLPFPVLMEEVFQVPPDESSLVISISGIIVLACYPLVGKLTERFGADSVLIVSSGAKTLVFVFLSWLSFSFNASYTWLVLFLIFVNRCTWPFMMAGSQIQAAQLSKGHSKTMALTVFMAIAGLGNFLSGFASSLITAVWSITHVSMVAAVMATIGMILLMSNKYRHRAVHYESKPLTQ